MYQFLILILLRTFVLISDHFKVLQCQLNEQKGGKIVLRTANTVI